MNKISHEEYIQTIQRGEYPSHPKVPLATAFSDQRGVIQNLTLIPITSTAVITSTAGSIRANHWHRTDWHFAYVVSGSILYSEHVGEVKHYLFKAGEMFFTAPQITHSMYFPEDTTFVTMAQNVRSHDCHEEDVVRVEFMTAEKAEEILQNLVK